MDTNISRRSFFFHAGAACLACAAPAYGGLFSDEDIRGTIFKGGAPDKLWKWSIEGFHYKKTGRDTVRCLVCPNRCILSPGDRSICRSKVNMNGKLYSLVYGNPCSLNVDPIEKKPLYHFYPATSIFSLATTGCNLRCLNCQNWEISQVKPEDVRFKELFPEQAVETALQKNIPAIAYTYSEANTYYEYMFDTARIARSKGIRNVWVSNGYINPEPLSELCRYLDGANVNLKSFDDRIYRKLNGGRLQPVLDTFKLLAGTPVWFEITTLVVPGYVDDKEMIKEMCAWIVKNLGPDYPLHFSRFYPQYKLDRLAPTPVKTLEGLRRIAMEQGIRYVYIGNVPGHPANHTYCHTCEKLLLKRQGYFLAENHIEGGRCAFCGTEIPGRWT